MKNKALVGISIVAIIVFSLIMFINVGKVAYSDEDPSLYFNGVALEDGYSQDGVSYSKADSLLILDNYSNAQMTVKDITSIVESSFNAAVLNLSPLSIELKGDNEISINNTTKNLAAIYSTKTITFKGTGTLTINVTGASSKNVFGIYTTNVNFNDSAKVVLNILEGNSDSHAIYAEGKMTVGGGSVFTDTQPLTTSTTIKVDNEISITSGLIQANAYTKGSAAYAIETKTLTVSAGAIRATGVTAIAKNSATIGDAIVLNLYEDVSLGDNEWYATSNTTPVIVGFPKHVEAKDQTCGEEGCIEHYLIEELDMYFSDAACTTEISKSVVMIEKDPHDFDAPSYIWDGDQCTAIRVCKNDATHIETETVTGVYSVETEATCLEDGVGQYLATFTDPGFMYQIKNVVLDKLNHKGATWYEMKDPTLTAEGEYEHYHCSLCNKDLDKNGNILNTIVIDKKVSSLESEDKSVLITSAEGWDKSLTAKVSLKKLDDESLVNALADYKEIYYALDISLLDGATEVQPSSEITISFALPEGMPNNFALVHIHGDKVDMIDYQIIDGKIVFSVNNLSTFALVKPIVDTLPAWVAWLIFGIGVALVIGGVVLIDLTPRPIEEDEFKLNE